MPTGEIEILVSEAVILNPSQPMPFQMAGDAPAAEEIRLKYRYLDLRRGEMQRKLAPAPSGVARHARVSRSTTVSSTSRRRSCSNRRPKARAITWCRAASIPDEFYALPQSPQLLKQILMIGGFDRYYQIARCFRDEDLRANRQPEFSQIDIEMTGPRPEDIMTIAEGMIASIYRVCARRRRRTAVSADALCRGDGSLRQRQA